MKKKLVVILVMTFVFSLFTGCEKKITNEKEINEYTASMEKFFNELETIDKEINSIDAEAQGSVNELSKSFDKLQKSYSEMASLTAPTENVPKTFQYIDTLADQASDYMTQANDYLKDAYSDTSYNENTVEVSMECYKRANKRVQYIITLLHGEYPQDDTIKFNEQ